MQSRKRSSRSNLRYTKGVLGRAQIMVAVSDVTDFHPVLVGEEDDLFGISNGKKIAIRPITMLSIIQFPTDCKYLFYFVTALL